MRRKEDGGHKKQIAKRLHNIRTNLGMTQEQFAEILEISVSAYKKVESGENQISIESLSKLNRKLKISSDYILFGLRKPLDETWNMVMNCSEADKIVTLLRLSHYLAKSREGKYLTEKTEAVCDKEVLKILKTLDL